MAASRWMTLAECAEYLRYTGPRASNAVWMWLQRRGIPTYRRGKFVLVELAAVDAAIERYGQRKAAR